MAKKAAIQDRTPWATDDKEKNRTDTIITPYIKSFGRDFLPINFQFISISGQLTDTTSSNAYTIHSKSELAQFCDSGLIKPFQYNGIDKKRKFTMQMH